MAEDNASQDREPGAQTRVEELFRDTMLLPPEERDAFLDSRCQGDETLRAELNSRILQGDASHPTQESAQIGPFRILETVGEGGMGTVYVAEQREPIRRKVALKVIKLGMDTKEILGRFEVEQHALTLMNHPNVARVFDSGATPEGRPYFVMEYVPGVPVTDFCDRERLTPRQRLELFLPICFAVQHAHQKGVIHRDLKPSNILVMLQDGHPVPKIIDFGLAKATGQRLTDRTLHTELGQVMGTPEYMSPEQADPSALGIDTRTDVYSLGVILYELLVGALPFDGKELRAAGYAEMQRIIREEEPSKPSTRLSSLGSGSETAAKRRSCDTRTLSRALRGDLDWITMMSLEKNPSQRYESPSALARDLESHLADEPVVAGKPTLGYRLLKFARRNRAALLGAVAVLIAVGIGILSETGALIAGVAVLVLLVIGLGISTRLLRQAQKARLGEARQREAAEQQRSVAEEERERAQQERQKADQQREIAEGMEQLAKEKEQLAQHAQAETAKQLAEVLRLSDIKRLAEIEAQASALWPAVPDQIAPLQAWLTEAQALAEHLPEHEATLQRLRAQALAYGEADAERDRETHPNREPHREKTEQQEKLAAEIDELKKELEEPEPEGPALDEVVPPEEETGPHVLTHEEKRIKLAALRRQEQTLSTEIAELAPTLGERIRWRFAEPQEQWRHDVLSELVTGLQAFTNPEPKTGTIAEVEERLAFANTIEARTVSSAEARGAWQEAIADIGSLPIYSGLKLAPQLGLVPLRRDASSGLWEFWHVASGARPEPNPDEEAVNPWLITEDTGLVLVLIPGGTFTMGAQKEDPQGPNFDPQAAKGERPPHEVTLAPYFLSRYLMTQGQWRALTGSNPSYSAGMNVAGKQADLRYPVEQVSWYDSLEMVSRLGLHLPTEAQWERAARAGTNTPWWTGAGVESLAGAANLADRFAKHNGPPGWICEETLFDGFVGPSPVGAFRSNDWGLHDVLGNVWEWCLDGFGAYDKNDRRAQDGELIVPGARGRVARGGSFRHSAVSARCAARDCLTPESRGNALGVRPARVIS